MENFVNSGRILVKGLRREKVGCRWWLEAFVDGSLPVLRLGVKDGDADGLGIAKGIQKKRTAL